MKRALIYLLLLLVVSCGHKSAGNDSDNQDSINNEEIGTFYLVQVATGQNFDSLQTIATKAATLLRSKVDMMKRIYEPGKGIVLPENCDDDINNGVYYPRCPIGDQNFVSIEMKYNFDKPKKWADRDTLGMVVIANIFTTKAQSDSVVRILKNKLKTAKTLQLDLYMGCMH